MWRYTRDPETTGLDVNIITNKYLRNLMPEDEEYKGHYTKEAVHYVRDLIRPFVTQLNEIQSQEELNTFLESIPYYQTSPHTARDKLDELKTAALEEIINLLIWDDEQDEPGVHRNNDIIDPWDVLEYINNHERLQQFFHPPSVIVDVFLNGTTNKLSMSRDLVLGVMAVYRYLHQPHPFSMYGFPMKDQVERINEMALRTYIIDYDDWYNVSVGNDVYPFEGTDFFQGLLTGADWNNIDPHTFITNLKQWKKEPIPEGQGLPGLTANEQLQPTPTTWKVPKKYTIDLNY